MKRSCCILGCTLLLALAPSAIRAQDKPSAGPQTSEANAQAIPLKLQVVLTEYDGTKKIGSLPYTISLTAMVDPKQRGEYTRLRDGVRVPILTASKTGENSMQYIDVGMNIDAHAARADADTYNVELAIERSSVVIRAENNQAKEWAPGDPSPGPQPVIRNFRSAFTTLLHEGHGAEATVSADPVTGHVLKVEVSLTVLK